MKCASLKLGRYLVWHCGSFYVGGGRAVGGTTGLRETAHTRSSKNRERRKSEGGKIRNYLSPAEAVSYFAAFTVHDGFAAVS